MINFGIDYAPLFLCVVYVVMLWRLFSIACPFTQHLSWLGDHSKQVYRYIFFLGLTSHGSSSQLCDIVYATIVNIFWDILQYRNQARFDNQVIPLQSTINLILSNIVLPENPSKSSMSSSVAEFMIKKARGIFFSHLSYWLTSQRNTNLT